MQISNSQSNSNDIITSNIKCSICFETIIIKGELDQCFHFFCFSCILKWSEQSHSCPQCRKQFTYINKFSSITNKIPDIKVQALQIINFKKENEQIAYFDIDNTYYNLVLQQIDYIF